MNRQKRKGDERGGSILSEPEVLQINDGGKGLLCCEHPYMEQLVKLAGQASVQISVDKNVMQLPVNESTEAKCPAL